MKYLNKSFSVGTENSAAFRDNYDRIFRSESSTLKRKQQTPEEELRVLRQFLVNVAALVGLSKEDALPEVVEKCVEELVAEAVDRELVKLAER